MTTTDKLRAYLSDHREPFVLRDLVGALHLSVSSISASLWGLLATGEIERMGFIPGTRIGLYRATNGRAAIDVKPSREIKGARVIRFHDDWRCEPAQTNRLTIGANNLGI